MCLDYPNHVIEVLINFIARLVDHTGDCSAASLA
jgi:hypothetical protein